MIVARALLRRPTVSCLGTRHDSTWAAFVTPAVILGAVTYLQRDTTEKIAILEKALAQKVEIVEQKIEKKIENVEKKVENVEKAIERLEKSNAAVFKSFEKSLTENLDLKFTHVMDSSRHIASQTALDTMTKVLSVSVPPPPSSSSTKEHKATATQM
mmetsp:Transcript_17369/g.52871  ORF Transcript_17369/g.52871 Transcript_17369/m.52871 type:complete len:157 (+) Transcript_17369:84-554(+)